MTMTGVAPATPPSCIQIHPRAGCIRYQYAPTCLLQDLVKVLDTLLVLHLADDLDVPAGAMQQQWPAVGKGCPVTPHAVLHELFV